MYDMLIIYSSKKDILERLSGYIAQSLYRFFFFSKFDHENPR